MTDKQLIVPLSNPKFPKKNKSTSNTLILSLKNKDLELNFYSFLDPNVMNKILERVLCDLGQLYIVCGGTYVRRGRCYS